MGLRADSAVIAVEFGVLGSLLSRRDGGLVQVPGVQQRRLLAALLVSAGTVVSTDRLVALLGLDDAAGTAVRTLRTYVFRLRKFLGSEVVRTAPPGYVLQITREQTDAGCFEALLDQARALVPVRPAGAVELLDEALSLWRGPAYAEFADEEFAQNEALRLDELRLAGREERFEAGLALGIHRDLVAELEGFVAAHPLRERARGQLMLALYRSGRQAEALATYRDARDLLRDELGIEPGPQLRELHQGLLRQQPELAWSALHRSAGSPPPRDRTSFVGRDRDVTAVTRALTDAVLVTLSGPGGVGKSRLARHVALAHGDSYPDGVWWCELAAVSDPREVAHAVAAALGVAVSRDSTVQAALVSALAPRRLLLVLDNCEHIQLGVTDLVEAILRVTPGVRVLATSRTRLGVAGEWVWSVAPLESQAAVELFVDRARTVRPNLTDLSADAVSDVCDRLDGLPLAVELAAARLRAMNVQDLAQRLSDRFALLTAGGRHADPRHHSLRSVIEWSYGQLSATERQVFHRLCVFAGGFTLDAAERVCAADGVATEDVPELISRLTDASIVLVGPGDGPVRYTLLETLRQFGAESIGSQDEVTQAQHRHADYYTELAEQVGSALLGRDEAAAGTQLDVELANLRAAQRWATEANRTDLALRLPAALFRYALWRMRDEVFRWAESAVDLGGAPQHPLYAIVCGIASWGCGLRGQRTMAVAYAERGLAVTRLDQPARFAPMEALGHVALWEGRLDEARDRLAAAHRLIGDLRDFMPAQAHALALTYDGRIDEALAMTEADQRRADTLGNPSMRAVLRFSRGEALVHRDPVAAAALHDEALQLAGAVRNRMVLGVASVAASSIRARHGDPQEALRSFRTAIDLWRSTADWTHLWIGVRGLVELMHRIHADEPAAVLHGAVHSAKTAAPPYGDDAERLARLGRSLAERLGAATWAAAVQRGQAMADDDVIEYALDEISAALGGMDPGRRKVVRHR